MKLFAFVLFAVPSQAYTNGTDSCHRFNGQMLANQTRQALGLPEGYKTCALVGSSGILLHERLGAEIDAHDMVMRFNLAPVQGYGDIVGSKTTMRAMSSGAIQETFDHFASSGSANMTDVCPNYTVVLNNHNMAVKRRFMDLCGNLTTIIDAWGIEHTPLHQSLKPRGKHTMTGIIGLVTATMICSERVDMYGFTYEGTDAFSSVVPFHYYGSLTPPPYDNPSESARLLTLFAAGEGADCVHLDTPVELQPLWEPSNNFTGNFTTAVDRNDPFDIFERPGDAKTKGEVPSPCRKFYDTWLAKELRRMLNKPDGFDSCAVVGSSGLLLHQKLGRMLDAKGMIMRFNLAPTEGYEAIVGSNTTIRTLNSAAIKELLRIKTDLDLKRPPVTADVCPPCAVVLTSFEETLRAAFTLLCHNRSRILPFSLAMHFNPVIDNLKPPGFNIMSGGVGVALASMICHYGVDVYGVSHTGTQPFDTQVPFHYFDHASVNIHDSLPLNSAMLSSFAEGEGAGCVRLHTPVTLSEEWKPPANLSWKPHRRDPLNQTPVAEDTEKLPCHRFYNTWMGERLRSMLSRPGGFDSCAIVGSSGLLLYDRLGPMLDKIDMVMRFNLAPTDGYEAIVGSNTTIRTLNSEALAKLLRTAGTDALERPSVNASVCPTSPVVLTSFTPKLRTAFNLLCHNRTVIIPPAVALSYNPVVKKLKPPGFNVIAGGIGVSLASMMCRNGVDVYGVSNVGPVPNNVKAPFHYFDDATASIQDSLPLNSYKLSQFAAREGAGCVRLHTPDKLLPEWRPTTAIREASGPIVGLAKVQAVSTSVYMASGSEKSGWWVHSWLSETMAISAIMVVIAVGLVGLRRIVGARGISRQLFFDAQDRANVDPGAMEVVSDAMPRNTPLPEEERLLSSDWHPPDLRS